MDLNENFRRNLANLIADRGISKTRAAQEAGVALDHLTGILVGRNGTTLKTITRICEGLKVDPIAMMEE